MSADRYFVVPAPGHYGDKARVISSHGTLAAARKAKGSDASLAIRVGAKRKGDTWTRSSEDVYPLAGGR